MLALSRAVPWHERRTRLVAAGLGAVAMSLVAWWGMTDGVFRAYDRLATDALYPVGPVDERIIVVAIDPRSVEEVGPWPWPRSTQAELLEAIGRADPDLVAYDVLVAPATDGDGDLAQAFARLGRERLVTAVLPTELSTPIDGAIASGEVIRPATELMTHALGGHVLVTATSDDGVVRALPLVVEADDGSMLPSLALVAWAQVRGVDPSVPVLRADGIQLGSHLIPTSRRRELTISWPAPLTDSTGAHVVSAADVLEGRSEERLRGRVVLVGVTDPTLGDRRSTPVAGASGTPGVMIHAAALNTMLTGAFVRDAATGTTALWALALALAAGLAFQVGHIRNGVIVAALGAIGYVVLVVVRFADGILMPVSWPLLALLGSGGVGLAVRYFGEVRRRQRVASLFSHYIPATAARELMYANRLASVMAGQHMEVSVMFCDLRGFTPTAGGMTPGRVRDLLNVFYEEAGRIIAEHEGTIIQYVGDEVFAAFGAPVEAEGHQAAALRCALALQRARPEIVRVLSERGLPAVSYGIGVHSGPVVAAHLGDGHRQYSLVGTTVNVASRLCSEADAGQVVYSERLRAGTGRDPVGASCGMVSLKGVDEPMLLWRTTGYPDRDAELEPGGPDLTESPI